MKFGTPILDSAIAVTGALAWVIIGVELMLGHIHPWVVPFLIVGAIAYTTSIVLWMRRTARSAPNRFVMSLKVLQIIMLGTVEIVYFARVIARLPSG